MANNEQINSLINQLAQRLNADKSQVESAVQKGNIDKLLRNMDSSKAQKISEILNDPEQSQKILSSPQAQAIIKKLMG